MFSITPDPTNGANTPPEATTGQEAADQLNAVNKPYATAALGAAAVEAWGEFWVLNDNGDGTSTAVKYLRLPDGTTSVTTMTSSAVPNASLT